jgi:hypothetical protein
MSVTQSSIGAVALLALEYGTLVMIGLVLGGALALYAIYWLVFKAGKD